MTPGGALRFDDLVHVRWRGDAPEHEDAIGRFINEGGASTGCAE